MRIQVNQNREEEIAGFRTDFPYIHNRNHLSETHVPWHWHNAFEFDYIHAGSAKFLVNGQEYIFHEGEAVFTNSNTLCSIVNVEGGFLDAFLFDPVFLAGHYKSIFETKYINPVQQNHQIGLIGIYGNSDVERKILAGLQRAARIDEKKDMEFQIRNLFSEIWLQLLEVIRSMPQPKETRSIYQERVQNMILYIQAHYQEKLTLDEIAASAALGKRECLRCFQNCIQESPFAYLLGYRIDRAKILLRTTDLPVTEIALQCGFSGSAYFAKIFRREAGMTPTEFRKKSEFRFLH